MALQGKWHGGKGSARRHQSVDSQTFASNWDAIFKKKEKPVDKTTEPKEDSQTETTAT